MRISVVAICAPLVGLAAAWPAAKLDDARRTYDTADNAQRATTKSIIAQSDHPDKQYWGDTLVSSIADCKASHFFSQHCTNIGPVDCGFRALAMYSADFGR